MTGSFIFRIENLSCIICCARQLEASNTPSTSSLSLSLSLSRLIASRYLWPQKKCLWRKFSCIRNLNVHATLMFKCFDSRFSIYKYMCSFYLCIFFLYWSIYPAITDMHLQVHNVLYYNAYLQNTLYVYSYIINYNKFPSSCGQNRCLCCA